MSIETKKKATGSKGKVLSKTESWIKKIDWCHLEWTKNNSSLYQTNRFKCHNSRIPKHHLLESKWQRMRQGNLRPKPPSKTSSAKRKTHHSNTSNWTKSKATLIFMRRRTICIGPVSAVTSTSFDGSSRQTRSHRLQGFTKGGPLWWQVWLAREWTWLRVSLIRARQRRS